jgi:hypothetical protein
MQRLEDFSAFLAIECRKTLNFDGFKADKSTNRYRVTHRADKKADISRTSLFRHEMPDKMLGFLHITDPVLFADSDKTKIKTPSIIVKEIKAGSRGYP